ncbi:MAG: hypothetical protein HOV81_13140 [Kofleriaceae bacterium]|nr:hypothetical protein [Kofleriaceae bacterium]
MLNKYTSLLAIPFVALVGCGGDDGNTPKPKPDAAVNNPVDAPPQATCSFANVMMGGLAFGSDAMPATDKATSTDPNMKFSWFEVIENTQNPDDPLNGRKQLSIGGRIPGGDPDLPFNDATDDVFIVNLIANEQGVFLINNDVNFNTDISADTYNAETLIFGNVVGQNFQNFYYATNGSIKVTQLGQNTGENGGITKGTVSAVTYHELDDNGAEVATGCKPQLDGMEFVLKTLATANGKPTTAEAGHDVEDYKALVKRAHELMAQRRQ